AAGAGAAGPHASVGVFGYPRRASVGDGLHQHDAAVFPLLPQPRNGTLGLPPAAAGGAAGGVWGGGAGAVAGPAAGTAPIRPRCRAAGPALRGHAGAGAVHLGLQPARRLYQVAVLHVVFVVSYRCVAAPTHRECGGAVRGGLPHLRWLCAGLPRQLCRD
nr:hypothetical protein [Tanacetum cinerariifolium]